MPSSKFKVGSISDEEMITALVHVGKGFDESHAMPLTVTVGDQIEESIRIGALDNAELIQHLLKEAGNFIKTATLDMNPSVPHSTVTIRREDYSSEVACNFSDQITSELALRILVAVQRQLPKEPLSSSIKETLGVELASHYETREKELRELKGIVDNLTKNLTDHSIKLQEEYEAKKTKLEEGYQKRLVELEKQFSKQESNLDARSNELDERAQALDDRESRHVRREIYKNFLV